MHRAVPVAAVPEVLAFDTSALTGLQCRGWPLSLTTAREERVRISIRLDPVVETRLENLAQLMGRSKAFYLRALIEQGFDDFEDA